MSTGAAESEAAVSEMRQRAKECWERMIGAPPDDPRLNAEENNAVEIELRLMVAFAASEASLAREQALEEAARYLEKHCPKWVNRPWLATLAAEIRKLIHERGKG